MPAILVLILASALQEPPAAQETSPHTRVLSFELTLEHPPLEGQGPAKWIEHEIGFSGALHIWTRSEVDLFLRVESGQGALLDEDDDSGGGKMPYLLLKVEPGDTLRVAVASVAPGEVGPLALHLVAAPETEATRAAAKEALKLVGSAERSSAAGDRERARAQLAEALATMEGVEGSAWSGEVFHCAWKVALAAHRLGALETCRSGFAMAHEHMERAYPKDHARTLGALANIARTIRAQGDLNGARRLQEQILETGRRTLPEDDPLILTVRNSLSDVLREQGELKAALAHQVAVIAACERSLPEDDPDLLAVRLNLACTKRELGHRAEARALLERGLAACRPDLPNEDARLLAARLTLAIMLKEEGDLLRARALEEAVLEGYVLIYPPDHIDVLQVRVNLASTLCQQGDLAGSRALLEAVLDGYEDLLAEDHPHLSVARNNLAVVLLNQGDLDAARRLQEIVLRARERVHPEDHPELSVARMNLAATIYNLGLLAEARALHEDAVRGFERSLPEDHHDLLFARLNLSKIRRRQGDLEGARELQEEVLEGCRRTLLECHPTLLHAHLGLADTLYRQGHLAQARELQESALEEYAHVLPSGHPHRVQALYDLALTVHALGEHPTADLLGRELAGGVLDHLVQASSNLSSREARAVASDTSDWFSVVRYLSAPERAPEGLQLQFELAETIRDVANLSLAAEVDGDPEVSELRAAMASVRARIGNTLATEAGPERTPESVSEAVFALGSERDELERRLRSILVAKGAQVGTTPAPAVARGLPSGAAAIGYFRARGWRPGPRTGRLQSRGDILGAHVLLPDGTLAAVELGRVEELGELAGAWRAALGVPLGGARGTAGPRGGESPGGGETSAEAALGQALCERVLEPLLAELPDEVTTLFVCSADLVHAIPLEALPLGEGVVGDRYRIVNEVSLRRFVAPPRPLPDAGAPEMLVLGGVAYDAEGASPQLLRRPVSAQLRGDDGSGRAARSFAYLPGSRREVERIGSLYGDAFEGAPSLLQGEAATKAAIHELAPGKRYLHVATHGWFEEVDFPEPQAEDELWTPAGVEETVASFAPMSLCGLALTGANRGRDPVGRVPGILTAEELAGIDLSACELAVLSACETHVGLRSAGTGIQSLQSALHAAGVRTAITSLWNVDDAATGELMERLYTYLWKDGLPKAEALWKAKCDLRAAGRPKRDWAAWVLSGDPE